ncbi:hypothetical protein B296_00036303 [Ensete ventricosum]|uniref:Uncharacterized protein n=1 Tax=Ensete ventricosum TaxID=4639 RepID=A0A426Z8C9_ENSVE|nr:hypothetical protein B296_00036303 [Ensete ventricosum]
MLSSSLLQAEIYISSPLPPNTDMGVTLSCPGEIHNSMNDRLEALIVRSLSFGDNVRSTLRSISFNGRDSKPANLKTLGPGKRLREGSVSFNGRVTDTFHSDSDVAAKTTAAPKQDVPKISRFSPLGKRSLEPDLIGPGSPKHDAAVKLQKVYKSFRTRRQLADCAVLVEQSWWKLLDFALLKRSSVSFFDIEKQESAVSRTAWNDVVERSQKKKGTFQHSSFLAGGATSAAGQLVLEKGVLKVKDEFRVLEKEEEEEEHCRRQGKQNSKLKVDEGNVSTERETDADQASTGNTSIENNTTREGVNLSRIVADPKPEGTIEVQQDHNLHKQQMTVEEHNMTRPENVSVEEEQEEGGEAVISSELIRRRINSKKGIESYQLGKKLSFKWTTGAGPRIGCVRDYPSELQFRALEQVCLSPTGAGMSRLASPRTARCQSPVMQEKSLLKGVLQQSHMQMTQEKSLLKEVLQQSHMQMTQEKS